jgi:hypothetical protein
VLVLDPHEVDEIAREWGGYELHQPVQKVILIPVWRIQGSGFAATLTSSWTQASSERQEESIQMREWGFRGFGESHVILNMRRVANTPQKSCWVLRESPWTEWVFFITRRTRRKNPKVRRISARRDMK